MLLVLGAIGEQVVVTVNLKMKPNFRNFANPKSAANNSNAARAQALLNEGLALHQKGRLAQAKVIYERVLKTQPKHFDALHLLGVIAYQTMNNLLAVEREFKFEVQL